MFIFWVGNLPVKLMRFLFRSQPGVKLVPSWASVGLGPCHKSALQLERRSKNPGSGKGPDKLHGSSSALNFSVFYVLIF